MLFIIKQREYIQSGLEGVFFNKSHVDLCRVSLDEFLYHFWLATNTITKKREIFKTVRNSIKTKPAAKKLLDELLVFSKMYRDLHEVNLRKWRNDELEIKSSIESIIKFKVRNPIPLMMISLQKYDSKTLSKHELLRVLQIIEMFTFVNTSLMNARSSGGVAKMYALHAKALSGVIDQVRREKVITNFMDKLTSKLPSKEVFLERFKELKYSDKYSAQKREVQYVVTKLFSLMFPAVAINPFEMSIEHIEPQSSKIMTDNQVAAIGNLWFLNTAFNNELGNAAASIKLKKYKASQLPCDNTLLDAQNWTSAEIESRTLELAEKFWSVIDDHFGLSKSKAKTTKPKAIVGS